MLHARAGLALTGPRKPTMATNLRTVAAIAAFALSAATTLPVRAAPETPAPTPDDASMTCEQIAAELAPYAQKLMPMASATAETAGEVIERGKQRTAEATPGAIALLIAATASHADPTGLASRAVGQAQAAQQQEVWQRSMVEDKPLHDKFNAQAGQLVAQGQEMQSIARLQHLMQLVQERHCDEQAPH